MRLFILFSVQWDYPNLFLNSVSNFSSLLLIFHHYFKFFNRNKSGNLSLYLVKYYPFTGILLPEYLYCRHSFILFFSKYSPIRRIALELNLNGSIYLFIIIFHQNICGNFPFSLLNITPFHSILLLDYSYRFFFALIFQILPSLIIFSCWVFLLILSFS